MPTPDRIAILPEGSGPPRIESVTLPDPALEKGEIEGRAVLEY
jgi:hypothetical protein